MSVCSPALLAATAAAASMWNRDGLVILLLGADPTVGWWEPSALIVVTEATTPDRDGRAQVLHDADGHITGVLVEIRSGLEPERLAIVVAHELGHALGLAHDEGTGGLMDPDGGDGQPTEADRALLRTLYGTAPAL